jgi:hypothetical protein
VIDLDATLGQQLFDIPVRQSVAQIPANRDRDHIRKKRKSAKLDLDAGTRQERRRIG